MQRWPRVPGVGAVAHCVNGRLVEPGPPAAAQDVAGFGVGTLGQDARLAGADRPPSLEEGVFDIGALVLQFLVAVGGSPSGPDDAGPVDERRLVHHLVQGVGLDLFHEPGGLAVPAGGPGREPVTETRAGEVLVGELDRDAPPRAAPDDDHFGVRAPVEVGTRPPGRQRVAGLRTVAHCLDSGLVQPRPPALGEGPAGFCEGAICQDLRLAGLWRHPPIAERFFDIGALPLKFWVAVLAGCHDRIVAERDPARVAL